MHQELRVSAESKFLERGGGGEEESDDEVGGEDEEEERNHVLHYFYHDSEEHTGALEEREDGEGLEAVEEAQKREEEMVEEGVVGGRNSHSEVEEAKHKAKEVEPIPEIREIVPPLLAHFYGLNREV